MFEYSDVFLSTRAEKCKEYISKIYAPFNASDNIQEKIHFKIFLLNRKISISIHKDSSLEDLYVSIYNAVYPDLSTVKIIDIVPEYVPKIYNVSLYNYNTNTTNTIPLHRFITLSSYIKANPENFNPLYKFLGTPVYAIYVLDEHTLDNISEYSFSNSSELFTSQQISKSLSSIKRLLSCYK